jgi:lipase chaperone LimK
MNDKAKEFRKKYKVENDNLIKDFINQEKIKIRVDKKLSDRQKRERLVALEDMLEDLNTPEEIMRRRAEEQWSK